MSPDWLCNDYSDRMLNRMGNNTLSGGVFVYCIGMCLFFLPLIIVEIIYHDNALTNTYASLDRSLYEMIKLNDI